jgi:hypothetical protein
MGGAYTGGHEESFRSGIRDLKGARAHQQDTCFGKSLWDRFGEETDKDGTRKRDRGFNDTPNPFFSRETMSSSLPFYLIFKLFCGKCIGQTSEDKGGNAYKSRKSGGKTSETTKTQIKADIRDPFRGPQEKLLGHSDPESGHIRSRRDPDRASEHSDKMPGGDLGFFCQFLYRGRIKEEFAHGVDRRFCPFFHEKRLTWVKRFLKEFDLFHP